MSGGSWDYAYRKFDEAAERLAAERSPLRRAFGERLALFAKAMQAIEWVDSGDWGDGDDIAGMREALGDKANEAELKFAMQDARDIHKALGELVARIGKRG